MMIFQKTPKEWKQILWNLFWKIFEIFFGILESVTEVLIIVLTKIKACFNFFKEWFEERRYLP